MIERGVNLKGIDKCRWRLEGCVDKRWQPQSDMLKLNLVLDQDSSHLFTLYVNRHLSPCASTNLEVPSSLFPQWARQGEEVIGARSGPLIAASGAFVSAAPGTERNAAEGLMEESLPGNSLSVCSGYQGVQGRSFQVSLDMDRLVNVPLVWELFTPSPVARSIRRGPLSATYSDSPI
ncbi:hypothetical protein VNO78_23538 [Psophocarpus tetragonolobus]|uniref:Uncharacterized protein n=1 Tax=Psophocarpus tetragonolobus TaxID=3891 RepID=A0AAN9XE37_PSOTE